MAGGLSHAATFVVNRGVDGDVSGCTLRNAINIINNDGSGSASLCPNRALDALGEEVALGENDTVLFEVTNITGMTTPLSVTRCVNINPNGNRVSLFGGRSTRLMDVNTAGNSCLSTNSVRTVQINNMRFTGGNGANGGALHITLSEVEINNSEFEDNTGEQGGGIYAGVDTALSINDSVIKNNTSLHGGGIFANSFSTQVTINRTQITQNRANLDDDGLGGGVLVAGALFESNNSEISENQANRFGGGIFLRDNPLVFLNNTTVSANQASDGGGGLYIDNELVTGRFTCNYSTISDNHATATSAGAGGGGIGGGISTFSSRNVGINSCIFAGNTGVFEQAQELLNRSFFGDFQYTGTNIFGNSSIETFAGAFGGVVLRSRDIIATFDGNTPTALASILSPLADNGGVTRTHALPKNSPAIDKVSGADCAAIVSNTDQREEERPSGGACDIGAFEYQQESSSFFVIPIGNGKAVVINL